jgi:hypothetical protein
MGALVFMMMSLRQGKNSESAETDIWGCSAINLLLIKPAIWQAAAFALCFSIQHNSRVK